MLTCNILLVIFTALSAVAALGSFIVGIIALVKVINYLSQKQIDALTGFYSQLERYLELIKLTLAVDKDRNNPLLAYLDPTDDLVGTANVVDVEALKKYVGGVLDLLLSADNQIKIKGINVDPFFKKLTKIHHIVYSSNPIIFKDAEDANLYAQDLTELMSDLINKIGEKKENLLK